MARRGKGEGTISKRPDGRWVARIDLGYVGASRKRKRLCLYGRTRAEAAERLTASLRKKQVGVQIRFEKQSVGEFLQRWLDDVRSTIRPRTHEHYEGLIRIHILPALGKHRLDRLTPQHIQQLLTAKSNGPRECRCLSC